MQCGVKTRWRQGGNAVAGRNQGGGREDAMKGDGRGNTEEKQDFGKTMMRRGKEVLRKKKIMAMVRSDRCNTRLRQMKNRR